MPDADQLPGTERREDGSPQPRESVERSEAPDAAIAAYGAPTPHFSVRDIFVGADGLRAGWSLLLYFALIWALFSVSATLLDMTRHHAVVPWSNAAVHSGTQPSARSQPSPSTPVQVNVFLPDEAMRLFCIFAAAWLMAKIERRPTTVYGLGGKNRLRNTLAGLGWGVALLSLLVFTLRARGLLDFDARLLFGAGALRSGAAWLVGFVVLGVFEEYFFRGYMQFTLARGINGIYGWLHAAGLRSTDEHMIGFWTAALLLSFGFGFVHRTNAGESPIGLLAAALIGVVFCLSLWRTGSLWWAIGFHAAWDWAQSYLYGVADSGITIQGHLFSTHPVGRPVLSGGLTGPEGSIFILLIVGLTAGVILLTLPRIHTVSPPDGTRKPPLD